MEEFYLKRIQTTSWNIKYVFKHLSEEQIVKYLSDKNIHDFCYADNKLIRKLSPKNIGKFLYLLPPYDYNLTFNMSLDFILNHMDYKWNFIMWSKKGITDEIIKEYYDIIDWTELTENIDISLDYILNHMDYNWKWDYIFIKKTYNNQGCVNYIDIREELIKKLLIYDKETIRNFLKKIHNILCYCEQFPIDIIQDNIDLAWDINLVFRYTKDIEETIKMYGSYVDFNVIARNPKITKEIIYKYLDIFKTGNFIDIFKNCGDIDDEFLDKTKDFIDWYVLSSNKTISSEFVINHPDLPWYWNILVRNVYVTMEFVEKFYGKFNWADLSINSNFDYNIIWKYHNCPWDWVMLSNTIYLDNNLVKKYKGKLIDISDNIFISPYIVLDNPDINWNYSQLLYNNHKGYYSILKIQRFARRCLSKFKFLEKIKMHYIYKPGGIGYEEIKKNFENSKIYLKIFK